MQTRSLIIRGNNINNIALQMAKNNEINCLLKFRVNGNILEYKADGLQSLKEKYKSRMNYNLLVNIFNEIKLNIDTLNQFMIYEEDLYLTLDLIFMDLEGKLYFLLNLDKSVKKDIKNLFNEIMNTCYFEVDDNAQKLLNINNYFNTLNYSFDGLLKNLSMEQTKKHLDISRANETRKITPKITDIEEIGEVKEKKTVKDLFSGLFKKKPYKTKSLDIDFKLPKNS